MTSYYIIFKKHCKFYITKFGLHFWRIRFEGNQKMDEDVLARVRPMVDGWYVTIDFNKKYEGVWTKSLVDRAAKHEILHIVFSPIEEWSKWRFVDEKTLDRELSCLELFLEPHVNNPHFFLGRLRRLAKERFVTDGEISQEIHRLIVYLEALIK